MMCPTSCPSPTQLHLTTPYPTTCTVTSPRTPSKHHYHYHTTPHQGSDDNNTSTIRAKCLAEHCASPAGGGGGGGGWTPTHLFRPKYFVANYYHNGVGAGAAPGCLLSRAKLPKCLATAARAITFCGSPEKGRSGGGGGGGGDFDKFFLPTSNIFPKKCHNGVGVLSWP